jgi:hypothetical protein
MNNADIKKLREYAAGQIKSGRPKEDVFNEIYSRCNDFRLFEQIATFIQYIPDPVRIEKYGIYNTLFLILMIAIDIALILTFNFIALTILLPLTVLVAGRKTKYYQWITFAGGIVFIAVPIISFLGVSESEEVSQFSVALVMILSGILILLSTTIPNYLTPDYKVIEEKITNDDGKEVKTKRISFN